MDADDRRLVLEAQGGERPAFKTLVDRYRGRIYALAVTIRGDHESAIALTRETFVRAHRELPELEDPDRFPGWLARLAYQAGREAEPPRPEEPDAELPVAPKGDPTDTERALLDALLAALPERVRVALDLRYREGLGYSEIAETLEVPRAEVAALLDRGIRRLRTKLRPFLQKKAPG